MTRSPVRLLLASSAVVGSALALTGAPATGAPTTASSPVVTSVAPLDARIGQRLTIKGRNFLTGRYRNTVIFKRDGQRAIFVKASRATRTELTVVLPDKLAKGLAQRDGKAVATRFRVRVLSRRLARSFTALNGSPRVSPAVDPATGTVLTPVVTGGTGSGTTTPPRATDALVTTPAAPSAPSTSTTPPPPTDCDDDGKLNTVDLDDDNDLLPDSQEAAYGTDPCAVDTDGDGMRDWWEIQSALDLNSRASFPAAKRPWPNPNFSGDGGLDFDQDGLPARVEAGMWSRAGRPLELNYSDGDQSTTTSADPIGQDHDAYNALVTPSTEHLNMDGDRILTDDEKDYDADGLTNWDEVNGRLNGDWWGKRYDTEAPFFRAADVTLIDAQVINSSGDVPMWADPDIDGDRILDGADDQDHDGWSNASELYRGGTAPRSGPTYDLDGDGTAEALRGNPFNPCLPDRNSRACSLHPPFDNPWAPFAEPGMPYVTVPAGGPEDRSRPQELVPLS